MKATAETMSTNLPAFGKYNLHARLYPGLLAALPITVLIVPLIPSATVTLALPLFASSGILLFVVQQVRSMGIKAEERLNKEWDDMPTTLRLRLRNSTNVTLLMRRRKKLERLYGEALPDAEMEQREPEAADEVYVAATRRLITKVRQEEEKFPLVQEENISYGYRRNLLGAKWLALLIVGICLVTDGLIMYFTDVTVLAIATAVFHGLYLLAVLLLVKDSWVREIGERYADRLFEALDALDDSGPNL